jgi:hypothetical protein
MLSAQPSSLAMLLAPAVLAWSGSFAAAQQRQPESRDQASPAVPPLPRTPGPVLQIIEPIDPFAPPPAPAADSRGPSTTPFDLRAIETGRDIRPLRETTIRLAPPLETPRNVAADVFNPEGAPPRAAPVAWFQPVGYGHVADVPYQPLYFEEVNLERYGYYCRCVQPLVSAAHFYGTVPLLPYKMASEPPCELRSSLEYPPAATAAAPVPLWKPLSLKGVFAETAVVAGVILLFP